MTRVPQPLGPLTPYHSGKVRDTYLLPDPELLLPVSSDRLSTHDIVHTSEIPGKGEHLTALTVFWNQTVLTPENGFKTHVVAFGRKIYDYLPPGDYPLDLHLRALVVRRLQLVPGELIFRNYLDGSLYDKCYTKGLDPYGLALPPGLRRMARFDEPLFTPTEKTDEGDPPLLAQPFAEAHPVATAETRRAFMAMRDYLNSRSLELIDGKFEVAEDGTLADEYGTGDCCRFARLDDVEMAVAERRSPRWLDKQVARDLAMWHWSDGPRAPVTFSPMQIVQIAAAYDEATLAITGRPLEDFQCEFLC